MIGAVAGISVMYNAMSRMGLSQSSKWTGPPDLHGAPEGTKILVLGAGLAGMTAAFELRSAGYDVKVLEYREKAGGRCWTLRGGDTYTEMGGDEQKVDFAEGNYLNPGPWRIPSDHFAVLDYAKRFGVEMEPFIQLNFNAYVHDTEAFGGRPQRFKEIDADFRGGISELLAKVADQGKLDRLVSKKDARTLFEALKHYGALDWDGTYDEGDASSRRRGFAVREGGGASGEPRYSEPHDLSTILDSRLWESIVSGFDTQMQTTMFQPKGGMDMIAKGFEKEVGDLIIYNAKVQRIRNSDTGVSVTWVPSNGEGAETVETAEYCICTIPFSILGQIDHDFSPRMSGIISDMYYLSSTKVGLEFNRRFWEEDEYIYGGISYTNLPIGQIGYPSTGYFSDGPAVLLGAYTFGSYSHQFNSLPASERVAKSLEFGSQIHPQYSEEFKTGVGIAWHRVPWSLGCFGWWKDRDADYMDATQMDGRTLMAGEHISYLPAWMEGAILSALDATERLHAVITQD